MLVTQLFNYYCKACKERVQEGDCSTWNKNDKNIIFSHSYTITWYFPFKILCKVEETQIQKSMTVVIWQALYHPLCYSFHISVTSEWTVVNPTVKTTSQLEWFCIERLQISAWGHEGIPTPWEHGDEVVLSSCAPRQRIINGVSPVILSSVWKSVLAGGVCFLSFLSHYSFFFPHHEFLAFGRRQNEYSLESGKLLLQNLTVPPIKLF